MKKSNLITGIVYVLLGLVCLLLEFLFKARMTGSLLGFAVYCFIFGGRMLHEYFYWNSPKNRDWGREVFENEEIEEQDELNVQIRDKSGRYAYTFGLYTLSAAVVVIGILGQLGIIANARPIVFTLGGYLIVQLIAERVIHKHISKKF